MYLETTDLLAVIIALVAAGTLVFFTSVQNVRLMRAVAEYRKAYLDIRADQ